MKDQQWLIDRAARLRDEARAATGAKPFTDGEAPPLVVPGLVWRDPIDTHGWKAPEISPAPPDPRELARRMHADELKAEAVAAIDPSLIAAARAALDMSKVAQVALRTLEAEKVTLDGDLSEAAVLASLTIERRIVAARRAVERADGAIMPALAAMRQPLLDYVATTIRPREYLAARKLDEHATQITQQAGDLRLSVHGSMSLLENFLPPESESPVVEPPAPVRRKRLFERKPNQ